MSTNLGPTVCGRRHTTGGRSRPRSCTVRFGCLAGRTRDVVEPVEPLDQRPRPRRSNVHPEKRRSADRQPQPRRKTFPPTRDIRRLHVHHGTAPAPTAYACHRRIDQLKQPDQAVPFQISGCDESPFAVRCRYGFSCALMVGTNAGCWRWAVRVFLRSRARAPRHRNSGSSRATQSANDDRRVHECVTQKRRSDTTNTL